MAKIFNPFNYTEPTTFKRQHKQEAKTMEENEKQQAMLTRQLQQLEYLRDEPPKQERISRSLRPWILRGVTWSPSISSTVTAPSRYLLCGNPLHCIACGHTRTHTHTHTHTHTAPTVDMHSHRDGTARHSQHTDVGFESSLL